MIQEVGGTPVEHHRVVIIGGGFSGVGVGVALRDAGIDDFVILEKAEVLGGTWRDNTYPGCACDVPSQLYSFSFAPNPDWSRVFAPQPEIQAYLLDVAERFDLHRHVRLDTEVLAARWSDADHVWVVETSRGEVRATVLVAGTGPLHHPRIPAIEGLDDFEGAVFHTARWDHGHDLTGRRVAVVGTGSSAIQLVPEIQPEVARVTVFQRTPAWVLPKPDHAIPRAEKAAFRYLPGFRRGYRAAWYYGLEALQWAQRDPARMRSLEGIARAHLRRQVRDDALRQALTPSFALGCKRLLFSNTFYPAVVRDNVTVTSAVARVTPGGVVDADGVTHEVDTIVLATGFQVHDPPIAHRVFGRGGRSLAQEWQGSPTAYLGTTIPGYPNFYLTLGPNLGNGHTSALILIEAQAGYLVDALRAMDDRDLLSLEVRAPTEAAWNDTVQEALKGTVWNAGGCASWYLDEHGRNRAIYPWSTVDLRRRLAAVNRSDYVAVGRTVVAITGGAHGIGRATAEAFAAEGARVCIGDRDTEAAQAVADRLGGRAWFVDVRDPDSFSAFVEAVEAEVGPIDVFVNNAGVLATGPFLDESAAVEDATMGVNYFGMARGLRLVLPRMLARGRGHVVNVASLAGRVPVAGMATYVASKHAIVGLSAAVRLELEGTGVTLTTVMPTAVRTRMAAGIPQVGLAAVEAEDVAAEVISSWRRYEPEIAVPRMLAPLTRLQLALPQRVQRWIRARLDGDRLLTSVDPAVREAYEAEVIDAVRRAS